MKTYLGDTVYAEIDDEDCVILTTEDDIETTNQIVLEPEVFNALVNYVLNELQPDD